MSEIVPVEDCPEFGVTRDGRVLRIVRSRFGRPVPYELKQWRGKNGYMYVGGGLSKLGTRSVHRLIAKAFIPNPDGLPEVAHGDGNRSHNVDTNLRWDTRVGNFADKLVHDTHNRGQKSPVAKLSNEDVSAIRASTSSGQELADSYGVSRDHIYHIRNGSTRIHG